MTTEVSTAPRIDVRHATEADIPALVDLYRKLEAEMVELEEMWPIADALAEPVEASFAAEIDDPDSIVIVGLLEDVPLGFIIGRLEGLLPQGGDERIGSIRFVFVEQGAREISIGEQMRDELMSRLADRGVHRFDAHVLPGHRLVKNFFESGGFSARKIIMHNDGQ